MNDDSNEFFHSRVYQPRGNGAPPPDDAPPHDGAPPIGEPIDEHQRRDRPQEREGLIWYGDTPPTPTAYLVGETIPETGTAILGGQYGAAKTFVGADLAGGVIAGGDFAGRPVRKTGGVLWFAAEGETEIERRVYAAIEARGGDATQRQPFARQSGSVPCLTGKDAFERLKLLAIQAATHLRANFDCDLALIAIDTLSAAAGFDDENSAAETQKVMTMLATLAREAKALVLLIDHYGKLIDTGVRGSSAKSAAADAILACSATATKRREQQATAAWPSPNCEPDRPAASFPLNWRKPPTA